MEPVMVLDLFILVNHFVSTNINITYHQIMMVNHKMLHCHPGVVMMVSHYDDEAMPRLAPREAPPRLPDPAELDVAHPP